MNDLNLTLVADATLMMTQAISLALLQASTAVPNTKESKI